MSGARSSTTTSIVPSLSWYVTVQRVSVLPENIAPTMSWTSSSVRVAVINPASFVYELRVAVTAKSAGDSVGFDDPQPERLAIPNSLLRQTADQHDGEHVPVFGNAIDQLIKRALKPGNFLSIRFFRHNSPRCVVVARF